MYFDIRRAASNVRERFGCYSWQSVGTVMYCGRFADDYRRKEFSTNLEGRIHHYWQNHSVSEKGRLNTNKFVFDQIVATCVSDAIDLMLLRFEHIEVSGMRSTYSEYTKSPHLVHTTEALLLCHYRLLGECTWNRT